MRGTEEKWGMEDASRSALRKNSARDFENNTVDNQELTRLN